MRHVPAEAMTKIARKARSHTSAKLLPRLADHREEVGGVRGRHGGADRSLEPQLGSQLHRRGRPVDEALDLGLEVMYDRQRIDGAPVYNFNKCGGVVANCIALGAYTKTQDTFYGRIRVQRDF